jgi:hypothetical protein
MRIGTGPKPYRLTLGRRGVRRGDASRMDIRATASGWETSGLRRLSVASPPLLPVAADLGVVDLLAPAEHNTGVSVPHSQQLAQLPTLAHHEYARPR